MKNFTKQNFKTNPLWVRLIIMAFMLLIGSSSAWAWTVYYDNSATKWSNVYLVIGHDGYRRGDYKMTKVSGYDNLYSYTATDWGDAKYVAFSSTSVAGANSSLTSLNIPYYIFDANMTNANNKIFGGTAYVSDKAQLVLNDYIGFYIGEPTSWNQSKFFVWKTENSKNSYQAGCNSAETQGSNKLQIVYAKSGTYSLTHSASWAGVSTGAVKAGYGYYIGDGNAMKTLTPTAAPSYTFKIQTPISQGSTATVSSETATGKSMYGSKTVALEAYYVQKSGETTFTKLTKSGTALQTQSLAIGTYQVIPVVYDGKIYFKGTPQTLVVEESCKTPSVTLSNASVTYNGNPQKPTITIEGGAVPTKVTYNDTELANGPTNAGKYTVKVWANANANGNYCKLDGAEATSSFTITQKTPTDGDFTYTASKTYTGSALGADVKWVANTGTGAITTYYKEKGAADNTYTTSAPTNAGIYTIAVTTVAQGNYGVVTKLPLGDFKIDTADQETLTISNDVSKSFCTSSVTLTTDGGSGEGTVSYEITANSAGASIDANTLTATKSGTVTVVATKAADNNHNKATSAPTTFTFTLLSAPTFTEASATACKNTAFNLNSLFERNDGGAGTLEWYTVKNDTKVADPANVTIEETTRYYAKVKEDNCYSGESANLEVTINTPNISDITITPSTNSITVKATITGIDLKSMQVEVSADGNWATSTKGTTTVNGAGSFTCSVAGLQEGTVYKVRVGANTKTCPGLFTYADVQETTTTCSAKPAPAITNKATICPNTDVALTTFDNGVANVMWYSDADCTLPVATVNISEPKSYYARTQSGICYSEVAQLDLSVYIAPEQPSITPSGTIPVGQGKTATITVENYNANVTYTCYQGGNAVGTWNNNTLSITVGNALGETTYRIVASNPTCPNLTEETSFILDVKEAGAKIAILGSSALYTNDNTHFIPMYVQKEGITDVLGATKVTGFTWEYSANGSTNWAACSTGYQAAGPGMSNGGEKCNNWRANAVGYYRCKISYDVSYQYTNILQVTSATNNNSNKQHVGATRNLPIISVNTGAKEFPSDCDLNGDYPSKHADEMKAKISVDVKIFNKDGSLYYDRKARMNYRGSSSLNFKKKSYAFVTGKEKTKNEKGDVDTGKENLFGLSNGAKDKDWVLYAATPDPSMMRNRLAFDLYKEMTGKWGVSSMYVELVVNGEYKGVYVLMDKITNNEKRVNITSSNGFIVKYDKTDVVDRVENKEGDQKTFATSRTGTGVDGRHPNGIDSYGTNIDQRFEIEYPEKEDIEDAGGNWTETYSIIQERFEQFETALANKEYETVRSIIDYDSWADWFIISEYLKNQDTYRASNIFVFNGDKIEAWPLWDQELSFNNQTRVAHESASTTGLMATTSSIYSDAFKAVFWLTGGDADDKGGLLGDPCFVALVKSKWEGYKTNQLKPSAVSAKVTAYETELGAAQTREAARWPYTGAVRGLTCDSKTIGYYGKNEGFEVGYSSSKNAITAWANDRPAGLTTALSNYETEDLIFSIAPENVPATPWQPVVITVNVPDGYEYNIAYPELTAAGALVTESNDVYQIKIPRPTGDGWETGGNGTDANGNAKAQQKQFTVTATITQSTQNACGSVSRNEVTSTIKLSDVTEDCNPEIVRK